MTTSTSRQRNLYSSIRTCRPGKRVDAVTNTRPTGDLLNSMLLSSAASAQPVRSSKRCRPEAHHPALRLSVVAAAFALFLASFAAAAPAGAQGLSVPNGFRATVFASGLYQPTAIAVGPDHRVYVAQSNGVIAVMAKQGITTVASGYGVILGLAWYGHKLYVSSTGEVSTLTPSKNYTQFNSRVIVSGLPTGKHQNDGLAFHGGWMYLGVGSTCNACQESDRRSATIMRFHPDGSHPQIFARGLRNPYGLAFYPGTATLYATDNGRDDYGNSVPDELNRIVAGGNYGWPDCWGSNSGSHCKGTIPPVATFEPHSSADGLVFYSAKVFPKRYRGDAFVAEWGDSVNNLGTGHILKDVHWVHGRAIVSTFATGFANPLAVAIAPNNSLLVADFGSGIIWRIQAG